METDWSDTARSQEMMAASKSWKRQEIDSTLEPPEEAKPTSTLISAQ